MRHVYRIEDGGDWWDYSAESPDAAKALHLKLNYEDADLPKEDWPDDLAAIELPDDQMLAVRDGEVPAEVTVQSCRTWADRQTGLVGTTCE